MKVFMNDSENKKVTPWEALQWEMYLSSLEVPLRESTTGLYGELCENLVAEEDEARGDSLSDDAVAKVRVALESLSLRQRQIIHAHYWEGLSEHEIARRLGIHRTTVQVHLQRAIRRLKRHLSSKFLTSERAQNRFPHNACPARTKTEGKRDE